MARYPWPSATAAAPYPDLGEDVPWDFGAAEQQPDWADPVRAAAVRAELARLPALVTWDEVRQLRSLLAEAAAGDYLVVQAGDCAEDPAECTPSTVLRKAGLLDALAGVMAAATGKPVLRIGRIAGQFAKPRSASTEIVDGVELPVYRGHLVNGPEPTAAARRATPERMLDCYHAAFSAVTDLRRRISAWTPASGAPVWTSHEALVFDYELPLLRRTPSGTILASTHLPWIGERTRRPDGPHAMMLARTANPVACKVGPTTRPEDLLTLCARLDPGREPGRLTLIARMGAGAAAAALPPLVSAVRRAGHPVVWLCDPMHGNTEKTPSGVKVRSVRTVVAEVRAFQAAVTTAGGTAAGLHLETTPFDVAECVWEDPAGVEPGAVTATYCDPRLNTAQAVEVVRAWATPSVPNQRKEVLS
ncbi:3-deoxy-7-phosphoheptulonate synthase [Micromonospora carbonacea]|uniref:Phospho-2-dehydro-3-deoxyheptonate aldolase n=1 Tax=Micromonospora carbonacea TaxID=47853 RepID=A0A1C5ARA9_9ACTN|nr:3-deoxy-7-phosphoheptulonate synthase [Micromonospora carbonacea]SCF47777.1 3-deoxy-D-arabinoheptulosonate-7-phosphate synthase [Micromonospora carbonacea]